MRAKMCCLRSRKRLRDFNWKIESNPQLKHVLTKFVNIIESILCQRILTRVQVPSLSLTILVRKRFLVKIFGQNFVPNWILVKSLWNGHLYQADSIFWSDGVCFREIPLYLYKKFCQQSSWSVSKSKIFCFSLCCNLLIKWAMMKSLKGGLVTGTEMIEILRNE